MCQDALVAWLPLQGTATTGLLTLFEGQIAKGNGAEARGLLGNSHAPRWAGSHKA